MRDGLFGGYFLNLRQYKAVILIVGCNGATSVSSTMLLRIPIFMHSGSYLRTF
ncbi:hypothetical protein C8R41DRAFT_806690 [Lentinula lateritia]|uniref:Uncharacterized protein n=1 Tax=Lentinula lateritia TaxID=40482 RepID=A0ABQ8VY41_9AGAR|nr:hypothetical protein C8R41DRAFT_806690 [Lentinula lateritia]